MPRPTAAQLVYGSATVVLSTVALLLLSGTSAVAGVALIGGAALALGTLVALSVPGARRDRRLPAEPGARAAERVPGPRVESRTHGRTHSLRS
ncbi:hypothetical protein NX801_26490 [Streptomyces sp. LP05-1]|uniref:Secreted protein n=1 Tax=Streptomyces pyxinae TaxID=2970734 RepID=A0ABT2CNW2_9ACTN|nr:hypothetical protein [Streptomyces sp. LP05-1]MCS0639128.1 hypothetical protein [Streptomyces sp. LP05-1]